jgi:hypothetical protein
MCVEVKFLPDDPEWSKPHGGAKKPPKDHKPGKTDRPPTKPDKGRNNDKEGGAR